MDRFGNPYFTDEQQIQSCVELMHMEGFEGTESELRKRAEAWWMGDWSGDRCPSLDEAVAFLDRQKAERLAAQCDSLHDEAMEGDSR